MTISEKQRYFLEPGYLIVTNKPMVAQTIVGSCITVCLWDKVLRCGGMNHYVYDRARDSKRTCKYGDVAIEYLIKRMVEMGSSTKHIIAHVVGGASSSVLNPTVGHNNIHIASEVLGRHGINIVTSNTGGYSGKKVIFDTSTGEVLVIKLGGM